MVDSCRICGSKNIYLYYTLGNNRQFKYYRCRKCDLVNYDLEGGLDQEKYAAEFVDPTDEKHLLNVHQDDTYILLEIILIQKEVFLKSAAEMQGFYIEQEKTAGKFKVLNYQSILLKQ